MTSPLANEAHRYKELRFRLLASMPELVDDPECLLDTLDGLSDLKEQLASLIRSALMDETHGKAIDEYIKKLADRKAARVNRARKKRAVALHFMEDIGLKKIEEPDITITRKPTPAGVVVFADELLPDEFCRVKREPDKVAIKAALKDGREVPGAQLGNAGETLSVRI